MKTQPTYGLSTVTDSQRSYIVVGGRPWNHSQFKELIATLPGEWRFVNDEVTLDQALETGTRPRYIFFLHWSFRVPDHILDEYECVCFHMTNVPFGRGGSPLQNLISRGHHETVLTALRMVHEMDAGPVYFRANLSLEGTAEEIYMRAGRVSSELIARIIQQEPKPVAQSGDAVVFKRRKPAESRLPTSLADLDSIHDFIRMLDASGYPHAFLEYGGLRFEFRRAARYDGRVEADVRITIIEKPTE